MLLFRGRGANRWTTFQPLRLSGFRLPAMVPIILPDNTPLWLQIVIAGIVLVSLYFAIRAYWRSGRF